MSSPLTPRQTLAEPVRDICGMRGALTTQDIAFDLVRRSVLVEGVMVCKTAPSTRQR